MDSFAFSLSAFPFSACSAEFFAAGLFSRKLEWWKTHRMAIFLNSTIMPLIASSYRPPFLFRWKHVQTIYPTLFRRVYPLPYRRERLDTPDGDFLFLDWLEKGHNRLAVISHGMEGHSESKYVAAMAHALSEEGWDSLGWNMRGCGGEVNRQVSFYHSGKTDDLETVLQYAPKSYTQIALVGFSLGGNVVLKYLGEKGARGEKIDSRIKAAVAFSAPCDLEGCATELSKPQNWIYLNRFLFNFRRKIRAKMKALPGRIDDKGFHRIRTFKAFDDRYTAKDFGYTCAEEYWRANGSGRFLSGITVPTLLVNALDDPFLSPECYPFAQAEANPHFYLETPSHGGHVGFIELDEFGQFGKLSAPGRYFTERRAAAFLQEHVPRNPSTSAFEGMTMPQAHDGEGGCQ